MRRLMRLTWRLYFLCDPCTLHKDRNMVNLSNIVLGRKPLLIYGVKRGKVPTKLRPRLSPTKQERGSTCYFKFSL